VRQNKERFDIGHVTLPLYDTQLFHLARIIFRRW